MSSVAAAATDSGVLSQIADKDFAVRFVEPTNIYTGVDRALKYGLMFIGLVFLTYFMIEVASGLKAHPAQYVMVGVAQAVFCLLRSRSQGGWEATWPSPWRPR